MGSFLNCEMFVGEKTKVAKYKKKLQKLIRCILLSPEQLQQPSKLHKLGNMVILAE